LRETVEGLIVGGGEEAGEFHGDEWWSLFQKEAAERDGKFQAARDYGEVMESSAFEIAELEVSFHVLKSLAADERR